MCKAFGTVIRHVVFSGITDLCNHPPNLSLSSKKGSSLHSESAAFSSFAISSLHHKLSHFVEDKTLQFLTEG